MVHTLGSSTEMTLMMEKLADLSCIWQFVAGAGELRLERLGYKQSKQQWFETAS